MILQFTTELTDSQFHIWRTLVALAHVDGQFSPDEWKFLMPQILDLDLTAEQKEVLYDDMYFRRDVRTMFVKITEQADRAAFFRLANKLVYIDGDFDETERRILEELQKAGEGNADTQTAIDFARLCEEVKLAFAEDEDADHGMNVSVSSSGVSFSQTRKRDENKSG